MKRFLKSVKNIFILVSMLLAAALLIRDFVFWGIIPMFTKQFYMITYFGLLVDFSAYMIFKICYLYFEELFK